MAYWEIEVVGLRQAAVDDPTGRAGKGSGFIIVSAGRHDVPIPHWSLDLNAPSRALEETAKSADAVAKVYKLDALAYAAEDGAGGYLGHLGTFPPLIRIPAAAVKKGGQTSTAIARSANPGDDDSKPGELVLKASGARPAKFKGTAWKSWGEAKKGFATTFAPQLRALRERAAASWSVEDLTAQFGEGIHAGETLVVPLLMPGDATLSGDGVKAVEMKMLKRNPPALQLVALDVPERGEQSFTLSIAYEDGSAEQLPFFTVPKGTPTNRRPVLAHPVVTHPVADLPRPMRDGG